MTRLITLSLFILGIFPFITMAQTNPLNPFVENFELQAQRLDDLEAAAADHENRILKLEEVKKIIFIVKTFTDMDGSHLELYSILAATGADITIVGDRRTTNSLTIPMADGADLIVVSNDIDELNMNTPDVAGIPSENDILKNTTTPVMIASEKIFIELGIGPEFARVNDFDIVIIDPRSVGIPMNRGFIGSFAVTEVSSDALVIAYNDSFLSRFAVIWIYEPGKTTFNGFVLPGYRAGFPYSSDNLGSSFAPLIARKMVDFFLALP